MINNNATTQTVDETPDVNPLNAKVHRSLYVDRMHTLAHLIIGRINEIILEKRHLNDPKFKFLSSNGRLILPFNIHEIANTGIPEDSPDRVIVPDQVLGYIRDYYEDLDWNDEWDNITGILTLSTTFISRDLE